MNISGVLGILAAVGMFVTSLLMTSGNKDIFFDTHGMFIVFGGTLAACMLCFPLPTLFGLFRIVFQKIIGKFTHRHEQVIREVVDLARGYRENAQFLSQAAQNIKTPFLKEAVELTVRGGITESEVDQILEMRASTLFLKYEEEASIFKTMAKFPPAFGLMGTTLGMISLLSNMGNPDSLKSLGPSMAIGLVATLWGIALANLVFLPMAENLTKLTKDDELLRDIVIEGIKLVRLKKHPAVVEEFLKSYLLPKDREKMKRAA